MPSIAFRPAGRASRANRAWIALILLCLPLVSCGRYKAQKELSRTRLFAEIVRRENQRRIGDDRFFEDNLKENEFPEVGTWCAIALGRIATPDTLPLLYGALRSGDAAVRAASAFSIGEVESRTRLERDFLAPAPQAVSELVRVLDDPSISVRMRVVEALGKIGSRPEAALITRRLEHASCPASPYARAYVDASITALGRLADPMAVPALERLADSGDPKIRWRALDALAHMRSRSSASLFAKNLQASSVEVRAAAACGMGFVADPGQAALLYPLLPRRQGTAGDITPLPVRLCALQSLGMMKNAAAATAIGAAIAAESMDGDHPDQQTFAVQAASVLGDIAAKESEAALLPLLKFSGPIADNASVALARICRGNPERFFALTESLHARGQIRDSAWAQAVAELGGPGAAGVPQFQDPANGSVTEPMAQALAATRKNSTIAQIITTRGTMEIELFREDAPVTVESFVLMAKRGLYDGMELSRAFPFRVGGSIPRTRVVLSRIINSEVNLRPFGRGSLGMAMAGGNSDAGGFFIALSPRPFLDGVNTCFGHVISGIQVADRIGPGDRILKIHIKESVHFQDYQRY